VLLILQARPSTAGISKKEMDLMKDMKKHNVIWSVFFLSALLLSLAAVASAQDDRTCTMTGRAGEYGFAWTGTIILPTGAVPFAVVGKSTFDAAGNFSSTSTASVGGKVSHTTGKGTYTLNSDCTGTLTSSSYDQSGNLVNILTADTVSLDNMRETRGIMTSLVLPNGVSLPVAITLNARKLFPNSGNEQ
jgi:hypothetical protein